MEKLVQSADEMLRLGTMLGASLRGGEVIELIGDVGAGKTTFTKGLALGLGIVDDVQSPTFTVSRIYPARDDLVLAHYDFYRLNEPGVLKLELEQAVHDVGMVTVLEWGDIVEGVLPDDRLQIRFLAQSETDRLVTMTAHGEHAQELVGVLQAV